MLLTDDNDRRSSHDDAVPPGPLLPVARDATRSTTWVSRETREKGRVTVFKRFVRTENCVRDTVGEKNAKTKRINKKEIRARNAIHTAPPPDVTNANEMAEERRREKIRADCTVLLL